VGKMDLSRGDPKILVDDFRDPDLLEGEDATEIHIRLGEEMRREEDFYLLRSALVDHPGSCAVFLHLGSPDEPEGASRIVKASPQIMISPQEEVLDRIRDFPWVRDVWKQ